MGFFDKKVKAEQLERYRDYATLKVPKTEVTLPTGRFSPAKIIELVVEAALKRVTRRVRQDVRDQYIGMTAVTELHNGDRRITITLTHKKSGKVLTANSIIGKTYLVDGSTPDKITSLGAAVAGKLIVLLQREYVVGPSLVNSEDSTPKPDMNEAMAVANLLDKTRCAICGYADIDYPDWDMECDHTPEERAGD